MDMMERLKQRLEDLGYKVKETDKESLTYCLDKARNRILNDLHWREIPEDLEHVFLDMAVGEFLLAKKTFAPDDLSNLDLTAAVKEIKEGDTTVSFTTGEGSMTSEQRLTSYINYLLTCGKEEFASFRRLRW